MNKPILLIGIICGLIIPNLLFGYLDPGTGSYVFQIILAAFVGAAFTIKTFWSKIKLFIENLFKK